MMTSVQLLDSLEGNRRLTIQTIEAFPDSDLLHFKPADVLRPFSEMIVEILHIEMAYIKGIALGKWEFSQPYSEIQSKEDLLKFCKLTRSETLELWNRITDEKLQTVVEDPFLGAGPQSHFDRLFYSLENEIHHRGQGYIYLRLLGIEPPPFYVR